MNHLSLLFVLLLVTAATSCQRGEAPAPAPAPEPTAVTDPTPAPALVEGVEIVYACMGDEIQVVYARGEARVTLADGREVVLSRSPQQDGPGESYEAEGMGLSRQDNIVVLRQQGREPLKCKELSATA